MKRSALTAPLADRIRREAQPKSDLLQSMEDALKQYHQLADRERIDAAFGDFRISVSKLVDDFSDSCLLFIRQKRPTVD